MKLLLSLLILFTSTIFSQNTKLEGSWLITKAEKGEDVNEPYLVVSFNPNGKIEAMGMNVGKYQYDKNNNTIVIDSAMDKKFNGTSKILDFNDKLLKIQKDNINITLIKMNIDVIAANNKTSKLIGTWNIQGEEDETIFIKFSEPDEFLLVSKLGGITDRITGNWIYNKDEKSLIIIGFSELLKGKNIVKKISEKELVLEHNNKIIKATKEEKREEIEHLAFEYEDFDEDADFTYQLPWRDFDEMLDFLKSVSFIQYRVGTLLPEINKFSYSTIFSIIKADKNKRRVNFNNFSINQQDTMQYSENYKDDLAESYNFFFPKSEIFPYRIVGEESLTVPAGTFNCLVIEGMDGDAKVKYWMIIDKPGIYAKSITENISVFGDLEYYVRELEIIK